MTRVAILAYYYPPLGGAGVQRATAIARHLGASGWEPVVVTGPATASGRWTPRDETLDGPRDCELVRVAGPEPPRTYGRRERWLRQPSDWARWWVDGAAVALSRLRDVDAILATLSPFEGAAAAARAATEAGVPWVADLRDPWALDEMFVYPTRAHRAAELGAMGRVLGRAAFVVLNTPEAQAAFARRFPRLAPRTVCVPNGFDPAELAVAPEPRGDDAFRIVHTGYLHTELASRGIRAGLRAALGGAVRGVDIGARSHAHLVAAIDRLRRDDVEPGRRIEVHLAGVASAADAAAADRPYIRWRGYLPHGESVALLRSADALFLPMHDLPSGTRARIIPGKTYEYLGVRRPIVAAVPDGDARDLLARAGNAALARPADPAGIADAIVRVARGDVPADGDADVLAAYERSTLVARLAEVLDAATRDQRAVAAAA